MRYLILVPHQDDEMLGCYSVMKHFGRDVGVTVAFKGGGQPKDYKIEPEKLHSMRNNETLTACRKLGVREIDSLRIPRPVDKELAKKKIRNYLNHHNPEVIFTTFPFDNHPEHRILGEIIKEIKVKAFGFIVQTDYLMNKRNRDKADITIQLNDLEYMEKVELIDIYETQRHFLPNIVRRPANKIETFWRIRW